MFGLESILGKRLFDRESINEIFKASTENW